MRWMGLASFQYGVHPASTLPFGENGGGADKDQHGGRTSRRRGFVVDPAALVSGVEDASRTNPQTLASIGEQQLHAQTTIGGERRNSIQNISASEGPAAMPGTVASCLTIVQCVH